MNTGIKELHAWLKAQNTLPTKPERKRTFMDITGITRLENCWSDIYRFFFDQNESHRLGDLFIRSLEKVADIPENWLGEFSVCREYPISCELESSELVQEKRRRIDLLIKDERQRNVIIIENKVRHKLVNELNVYYKEVKRKEKSAIKGIVLSLYTLGKDSIPNYTCITHMDLLNCVKTNLPAYFNDADPQSLYLLQEFIQNAINMSNEMNKEELAFFIDNYDKVHQIHQIYKSVMGGYEKFFEDLKFEKELELKTKRGSKQFVYLIYERADEVSLTLLYDWKRLWNNPNRHYVTIVLELQGKVKRTVENWEQNNNEELLRINDKYSSQCNIKLGLEVQKTWCHYASVDVEFTKEDLLQPQIVIDKLYSEITSESAIYQLGKDIIELYNKTK